MRGGADVAVGWVAISWLGGGRWTLASEGTYSWVPSCSSPFPSSPSSPTEPLSRSLSLVSKEVLGRRTVSVCGVDTGIAPMWRHPPVMPLSPALVVVLLTSLVSITLPSSSSTIQPTLSQRWPRSVPLTPRALVRDPCYPTNSVPTLAQERPPGAARVGERPLGSHRSRDRDRDTLAEDTACREGRFTSSESLPCRLPLHLCCLHDDARRMPSRMRPVLVR